MITEKQLKANIVTSGRDDELEASLSLDVSFNVLTPRYRSFIISCVQGPGQLVVLAPSSATRFAKFHFGEETVVTGMLVTTHLDHTLRSFRVFANTRTSDPYDYTTEPQLMSLEFNVSYFSIHYPVFGSVLTVPSLWYL